MPDKEQISSSPRVMYGNATMYHDSPITEGQGGLLNSMCPSSQVDSVIQFLNVRQQRFNDNAEVMKELYRRRHSMMAKADVENSATLPTANDGDILSSTQLGFGGSDLDAFQYYLSQGLGIDIFHHADARDAAGSPVSMQVAGQQQTWAPLSPSMQTSTTAIGDESLACGAVARYHDKGTFTQTHATFPQSTNFEYSHAPEIGFGCARPRLLGQTLSPVDLTYTSDNRDDNAGSSVPAPPRNKMGGPSVLSFMSDGVKHYRCECGYESARNGDVVHHLESLQHSERKYECSCGKKFTRNDSLNRHRKRCRNEWC